MLICEGHLSTLTQGGVGRHVNSRPLGVKPLLSVITSQDVSERLDNVVKSIVLHWPVKMVEISCVLLYDVLFRFFLDNLN